MIRSPSRMRRTHTGISVVVAVAFAVLFATAPPGAAQTPASKPAAPLPSGYVGANACKSCHADQFESFGQTKMGRLFLHQPRNTKEAIACETCHGPGKAHVDAGGGKGVGGLITFAKDDPTPIAKRNEACLGCHTKGGRLFWQGSPHQSADMACTSCHVLMQRVSLNNQLAKQTELDTCGSCHIQRRAQQMRSSHMPLREGKMTCSSCHNPHGSTTSPLLKESSINDTCYNCHADKRGPFLWEHPPVVENCANCHDPHGTNHERMLKVARPRLCQQCHITGGHPVNPYSTNQASQKFVLDRVCNKCHVNIHGSNHPAGEFFER